ncbi:MAG: hypothetical protein K9J12_03255 [Melioribacteraceae bacterium]|nr:hypothetical protein [Melioribacteraceae bacterium]MCF8265240.1 hypothetical protein [Melioribacteraceae bacterium]MCF8413011.1 hypothetical protein [Melioribacteraceae bacterium]MCF8432716.1 hypothetical protein [Melioribacteraceae bacterium]
MRYILLLSLTIILYSCAPSNRIIPESIYVLEYDFGKYEEQGFLFTPNAYSGNAIPKGYIFLEFFPKGERKKYGSPGGQTILKSEKWKLWDIDPINTNKIISETYQKAIKMGGNSITNLKFEPIQKIEENLIIDGVRLTGWVIDRRD